MKVRVFVPVEGSGESYESGDFQFEAMPAEGQFLQLLTPEPTEYPIDRVGFIQEGHTFTAAVWLSRPPIDAWSLRSEAAENDLALDVATLIKQAARGGDSG
jgi:hypothetical protein